MAYSYAGGDISGGAGLVFVTLPPIFESMGLGTGIAILFFVMLGFAALASAVSLLEVASATVMDSRRASRGRAVVAAMVPTLIVGAVVSLGFGPLDLIQMAGMSLLDIVDYVSNRLMMPMVAMLMCILVGRMIGWVCPALVALVFISSLADSRSPSD